MEYQPDNLAYQRAFDKLMALEGGFILHEVPGDNGGATYAGISYRAWPNWEGWDLLQQHGENSPVVHEAVRKFYWKEYWDKLKCYAIIKPGPADELFCFGVVAGKKTAARLAQNVCGAGVDGFIGDETVGLINQMEKDFPTAFETRFKLGQVARYAAIVNNDRSQSKFLLGWINRALK